LTAQLGVLWACAPKGWAESTTITTNHRRTTAASQLRGLLRLDFENNYVISY
jgi:hypothetical protein